jgi:DNA-binding SARP family transcriptional activator
MTTSKRNNPAAGSPLLSLLLFGAPAVLVDSVEPAGDVLWRKHVALVAHLALSPDFERSRDHLIGLLWAERSQSKARHSLNEAIRRLRAGLGAERLVTRGDVIRLSPDGLEVDVLQFRDLRDSDPAAALALVRGPFMEGFTVEGAPDFEDWASEWRRRLNRETAELLLLRGEAALAAGDFIRAREDANQSVMYHPFAEPAVSLQMRAAALAGDKSGALQAFRQYEQRLRSDLGDTPGRELAELASRIRADEWQRPTPEYKDAELPLVGRETIHRSAFAVVERGVTVGPQCLLVVGDQGLGKSRLVEECAKRAGLRGGVIAAARPLASDHDAPWSTLRLLMRSALADAPGVAAADPEALSLLAALVPELAKRFSPSEPRDTAHAVSAIESLIAAVADEHPLCIMVDDAHWADGLTLTALGAAVSHLESCPLILLVTVDSSHEGSTGLMNLRSEVGRGIPGRAISLKPLTKAEMRELVSHLAGWCNSVEEIDRLARRINFEVAGNPFLAVTMLHSLERAPTLKEDLLQWPVEGATLDGPLPFSLPDLVKVAIVARVSDLDETSLHVLRAAAVGGAALDLDLISALTGLAGDDLEQALDTLERRRFITYNRVRYAFTAPLFAQVVRAECLTRGQRQRLRRQAIVELEVREDLESRVLAVELRTKTDPGTAAVEEAVTLARSASEASSVRTARRALAAAQKMIDHADARSRSQMEALRDQLDAAR